MQLTSAADGLGGAESSGATARPESRPASTADDRRKVVVVGLGFAGLPTAVALAQAGHAVVGLDLDQAKVDAVNEGAPVSGVESEILKPLVERGALVATTDEGVVGDAAVVVISVPTPLGPSGSPDQSAVEAAVRSLIASIRPGTLVVLQSTVVPGTTRRVLVQGLESAGLTVGKDVFVAYSPERVNPGDAIYHVANTKKLVAGATGPCLERGRAFVESFVSSVHPVSALEAAELSKLVENTFRFVNISFVNEVAVLCDRLGISAWEVIEAAATKPFSFLPHYPGPGVGGECIPVSPRFLQQGARDQGLELRIVPAAFEANDAMPGHVADRCAAELGRSLEGRRIVVVGVAYKPNLADARHSPAVPLMQVLRERGAEVAFVDPLVSTLTVDGTAYGSGRPDGRWPEGPAGADAAILVTAHACLDYEALAEQVPLILDTRNALAAMRSPRVVPL